MLRAISTGMLRMLLTAWLLPAALAAEPDRNDALIEAVEKRDLSAVKELTGKGVELKTQDPEGNTPLLIACRRHSRDIAQFLLERGAEPGATNDAGAAALMLAALGATDLSLFDLLLAHHAEINARDQDGRTALFYAATARFSEAGGFFGKPEAVEALLARKADLNIRDQQGDTVFLFNARQRPNLTDAPLKIARVLLANGSDINATNRNGETALMIAAAGNSQDLVRLLIESRADLNMTNKTGDSALGLAIQDANTNLGELLTSKGASLRSTPYPSHEMMAGALRDFSFLKAASQGDSDHLESLLEQGAPVNFRDRHGRTALMRASEAHSGGAKAAMLLLAKRGDVGLQDENGDNALILAARHYNRDILRLLLQSGADPGVRNRTGGTALFAAAESGDQQAVEMLLAKGALVNVRNDGGETPLLAAAKSFGGRSIIPALLAKGADVNAVDREGRTALMNAAASAEDDAVNLLLKNGANVNARTRAGLTAVKLVQAAKAQRGIPRAFIEHLDEIIVILRKAGASD
jgi:ankyrin repeat protein